MARNIPSLILGRICHRTKCLALENAKESHCRMFSSTRQLKVKQIHIATDEVSKVTRVAGSIQKHENKNPLQLDVAKDYCALCPVKLGTEIKYTDVLILSQFVKHDGTILPREVTGLCQKAHTRLRNLVHQALMADLMPELTPKEQIGVGRDVLYDKTKWRKYNVYYTDYYKPNI